MVAPLEPAALNFLGLQQPGPNVATGTVPDPTQAANDPQPVTKTADLVEISPAAQNAARAVRPTQTVSQGPNPDQPVAHEARGITPAIEERQRAAAIEQARVNAESSKTPIANVRNTGLRYRMNEELGRAQISVVDRTSHEVIREIPPEERIRIAERLQATLEQIQEPGLELNEEA